MGSHAATGDPELPNEPTKPGEAADGDEAGLRVVRKRSHVPFRVRDHSLASVWRDLDDMDRFERTPTPRSALPDPGHHTRNLVLVLLEVIQGRRPLNHLMPHLTNGAYERLNVRLRNLTRRNGPRSPRPGARDPVQVGRPRVCEPADGVAEASIVALWNGQAHAVVIRLEGMDGRWHCTLMDIV